MLTKSQINQFHRDGFLLGPRVLDDALVDALREELTRVIDQSEDPGVRQPVLLRNLGGDTPIWQIVNIWEASAPYRALLHQPTIVEEIAQLLDAREVRLWHDQIQYKVAGKGGVNFWHQDSLYWPIVTPKNTQVTAWVALDDVDEENGCMWMVPGSQGWGDHIDFLYSLRPTGFRSMPASYQDRDVHVKACPVRKGCVHYHHALTWHGSDANRSDRPRRAVALHFMNEQTTYVPSGKPHPMDQFVAELAVGDKLTGDHFPLVWQEGQPVEARPNLVASVT